MKKANDSGASYGIELSVERPTLDGRLLDALIEKYLADVARRSDPKTVDGYRHKLRPFRDWWISEGPQKDWCLSVDDLADFLRHLENAESARGGPLAFNTKRDVIRRLRQVFRWAHKRGHIPVDFSLDVPSPTGGPPPKKPIELASLGAMLEYAKRTSNPLRDRAIIAVLAGTGIRCEECAALLLENVTLYADGAGVIYLAEAKNSKPRNVAFDTLTGEFLSAYLSIIDDLEGPLFRSRKGRATALSSSGLYKMVSNVAKDAQVDDQIRGPHDLRRLFATLWSRRLRGSGYGQLLQKQLGHVSWETTQQHYVLQDIGDVLEVLQAEKISPLAQLAAEGRMEVPRGASPFIPNHA